MRHIFFPLLLLFPLSCGLRDARLLWVYEDKYPLYVTPAVDENHLYLTNISNEVLCFNRYTGRRDWIYEINVNIQPMLVDVCLIPTSKRLVFNYGERIFALDKSNGELIWSYFDNWFVPMQPTIHNNQVYLGMSYGDIIVLDLETGELLKRLSVGKGMISSLTLQSDYAFFTHLSFAQNGANEASELVALNINTGGTLWRKPVASGSGINPVVDGECLFYIDKFGFEKEILFCLEAVTGKVVWEFAHKGSVGPGIEQKWPVVEGDSVYASLGEDGVFRINRATGDVEWRYSCFLPSSRVAVSGNHVYLTRQDSIICLNKNTGLVDWNYRAEYVFHSPVLSDNQLYFLSEKKLIALRTDSR